MKTGDLATLDYASNMRSPPFGGGTHNCLTLPHRDLLIVLDEAVLDHQEDGVKLLRVFDIRNPASISPAPAEAHYAAPASTSWNSAGNHRAGSPAFGTRNSR
jgi:hypothetical protein